MHHLSPDHTVVTLVGPDALAFLQSQLTNDVATLAPGAWQWQGYCSAKGRLYATFALVRMADDAFAAVVHNSVLATLVKRLTMHRLRAKLAIETPTTLSAVLHLARPDINPSTLATLDLGHERWITIESTEPVAPVSVIASDAFMQRWNLAGIAAMQPEITAATSEMFVPQMIGWDTIVPGGGVSFSKGCFPGQEVVARAHYRGAVKRHLERQILDSGTSLLNGAEATLDDGRVADICNVAQTEQDVPIALVVVAPVASATHETDTTFS